MQCLIFAGCTTRLVLVRSLVTKRRSCYKTVCKTKLDNDLLRSAFLLNLLNNSIRVFIPN